MTAGRFDSAEHLYKRAIASSDDATFKASAAIQLLILMTNRGKHEPKAFAEAILQVELPQDLRAEAISALAGSYALAGCKERARALIGESLTLADYCEEGATRIRALQRIGFASFYVGDYEIARRTSNECARLAEHFGYYILAARAYSVLAVTEMACGDEVARTRWYTEQNALCAAKGGDRLGTQTALFQMYEIEARLGNVQRMESIEADINAIQTNDPFRSAMVVPLRAMLHAWKGDFAAAYRLACGFCGRQAFVVLGALRRAECAVYLSASGRRPEAIRYADRALNEAKCVEPASAYESQQVAFALTLVGLAQGIVGRSTAAMQVFREVRPQAESPSALALAAACTALLKAAKSRAYDHQLLEVMDELNALGYGGYVRLLEALFQHLRQSRQRAILGLTRAEVEVLEELSKGSSPKRIAQGRGRSVHTIQAQIRSVIDKLGCSGRGEALALARQEGVLS